MRWAGTVALAAIAAVISAALAFADVGGPPTVDFNRCFREIRPCSDPIVLGEAAHLERTVEIIGHSSGAGTCLWIDSIMPRLGSSGVGWCGGELLPPDGDAIYAGGYGTDNLRPHRLQATQIDASLTPEVARVEVVYPRNGVRKVKDAAVTQVDEPYLEQIGAPEPFGVAELTVAGCIPGHRFRITALDSSGTVLDTAKRFPRFFNNCHGKDPFGLKRRVATGGSIERVLAR